MAGAGAAQAERQPSLDEALAQTFQSAPPAPRADLDAKRCRTLTDLGRRARRATVCMAQSEWAALINAAKPAGARKLKVVKVSAMTATRTVNR